jgi:hypothetical protein
VVNDHDRQMWVGMAVGILLGFIVWSLFAIGWRWLM